MWIILILYYLFDYWFKPHILIESYYDIFKCADLFFFLPVDFSDEKEKTSDEHDLTYDELKTNILDHQAVME